MIKKKKSRRDEEDNGFAQWGGYMAAKKAKLEDQFLCHAGKEGQKSDIFRGIAIFVNGYTNPTADQLKQIMVRHGGIYHHYQSHSTTHIIASNLPDCKVKQLKTLNVVKPAWIVDSVKAGKLLDYKQYLLYSNETKSQPRLNFVSLKVFSAKQSLVRSTKEITEEQKPVFNGEGTKSDLNMEILLKNKNCEKSVKSSRMKGECKATKSEEIFVPPKKFISEVDKLLASSSQTNSKCSTPSKSFPQLNIQSVSFSKSQKTVEHHSKDQVKSFTCQAVEGNESKMCARTSNTMEVTNSCGKVDSHRSVKILQKVSLSENTPKYTVCQSNSVNDENEHGPSLKTHVPSVDSCGKSVVALDTLGDGSNESFARKKDVLGCRTPKKSEIKVSEPTKISSDVGTVKLKSPLSSRKTASDPGFLSEFYGNSRLHHLSTMGALFKDYVAKLREEGKGEFPGIKRLSEWKKRRTTYVPCEIGINENFIDDLENDCMVPLKGGRSNKKEPKTIMHVDMDCFFVSVGLRSRPDLRCLPVAVTHAKKNVSAKRDGADLQFEKDFYYQKRMQKVAENGGNNEILRKSRINDVGEMDSLAEIASCNYEARKAGLKNGMFFGAAIKLCPNLKTIPYDFEGYKEVSYKLYNILASYTLDIEAVSCDEMYVDCTEVLKKTNTTALEFASFLREEIQAVTGCCASAGIGSNPLQARLATKKAKPNGQFHLMPQDVERFMQDVTVQDLPGVGYSLTSRLHSEGIYCCQDLQHLSLSSLQKRFGQKTGQTLFQHSRGEDDRRLDTCHQRKSFSAEVNYGIRFTTQSEAEEFLQRLSDEVAERLQKARSKGKLLTLKLMVRAKDAPVETAKYMGHGACDSISRSVILGVPTNDPQVIYREIVSLEKQLKIPPNDLRGIGIQVAKLAKVETKNNMLKYFLAPNKPEEKPQVGQRVHENKLFDPSDIKESSNQMDKGEFDDGNGRKETRKTTNCNISALENGKQYFWEAELKRNDGQSGQIAKSIKETPSEEGKKPNVCNDPKPNIAISPPGNVACMEKYLQLIDPPFEVPMMTLAQARKLVRAWVSNEEFPQDCDILMFAYHMQRLVLSHHLEDLEILFSLLHRILLNRNKWWKNAYRSVVESTQNVMRVTYGSDLKVPEFGD